MDKPRLIKKGSIVKPIPKVADTVNGNTQAIPNARRPPGAKEPAQGTNESKVFRKTIVGIPRPQATPKPVRTVAAKSKSSPPKVRIVPPPPPQPKTKKPKPTEQFLDRIRPFFKEHLASGKKFDTESKRLASEALGLTIKELEWGLHHLVGKPPCREIGFLIEKEFFGRAAQWNEGFSKLARLTADELNLRAPVVYTWLNMISRLGTAFRNQTVQEKLRERILAEYENYLAGSNPPSESLHKWIAGRIEESPTPAQVGHVLINHRQGILHRFKTNSTSD